jgi:diguanylate cyclase (GGDEF)-like protein
VLLHINYRQARLISGVLAILFSLTAQANQALLPAPNTPTSALISLNTHQIIDYLIAGFSFGIIIYHVILYACTHQSIYIHFCAALLVYTLAVSEEIGLWHLLNSSQDTVHIVVDTLNLILFISFILHFLNLFVNFKHLHPHITRTLNMCMVFGLVLVFCYLLFPHPLFYPATRILIIVACLTGILTPHYWYPTVKHLRPYFVSVLVFILLNLLNHIALLINPVVNPGILHHLGFVSGALMFISFSTLISNRLSNDRTQLIISQANALENLQKYQTLYQHAIEGLFTTSPSGRLLTSNPALKKLLNLQYTGQPNAARLPMLHRFFAEPEVIWKRMTQMLQQGAIEHFEIEGLDGIWYSLSAHAIKSLKTDVIEGSLIDISLRKHQDIQLSYLASHDPLTQLYNRHEFENYLQDAIHSQSTHSLLFIDLDQFKVINDTCGHAAGDECLKQITALFKNHVGVHDMLARLGGDEFGIVLWNQTLTTGKASAEAIRLALENNYFHYQQRMFKTSVCIGVVLIDELISCGAQALSLADAACYEAKEAGRNHIVVSEPKKESTRIRHSHMNMASTLTHALKDDDLVLYRQDIVSLTTDTTSECFEILLRLQTDDGLLNPGGFLPAAQRYQLLPDIDRWVFNKTCAWLAAPGNRHYTGSVNLNLSLSTLQETTFISFVNNCLLRHTVKPERICFEITEYNAFNHFIQVLQHITQLRTLGFRFALDDFGSGFATFDYMKRLPIDIIKIDGRFIKNLLVDKTNITVVRTITDIAHQMGKKVIAKSVENQQIADLLCTLQVDFGQGYYWGEPTVLFNHIQQPVVRQSLPAALIPAIWAS